MIQTEEQIFIIYSVKSKQKSCIDEACKAISSFQLKSSIVSSVLVKPFLFKIPAASDPGKTLNSELIRAVTKFNRCNCIYR